MSADPGPSLNPTVLAELLAGLATGRLNVAAALEILSGASSGQSSTSSATSSSTTATPTSPMADPRVSLDLDRERRCGFPEVIYGAGKPADLIAAIITAQRAAGQASLATRVTAQAAQAVQALVPGTRFNPIAKTLTAGLAAESLPSSLDAFLDAYDVPHVAVITAGSTDAPVAEEAIETLHWMGIRFRCFDDIGVAGPARLLSAVPRLRQAAAAIVIAGMEGALPAAVGGHLSVPVFAVPTSVGYGATLGGLTPLMGMLSCCASNVAVVNIDAGFKAAYLAGLVVRPLLK